MECPGFSGSADRNMDAPLGQGGGVAYQFSREGTGDDLHSGVFLQPGTQFCGTALKGTETQQKFSEEGYLRVLRGLLVFCGPGEFPDVAVFVEAERQLLILNIPSGAVEGGFAAAPPGFLK